MRKEDHSEIATRRILNILRRYPVAGARTLEQKIADAGPNDQRVDPHILTPARRALQSAGTVLQIPAGGKDWYTLENTDQQLIDDQLNRLVEVDGRLNQNFNLRVGQALEIAVFRSLTSQNRLVFYGHYESIDEQPDSTLYTKREPPNSRSGKAIEGKKNLDFLVEYNGCVGGVEVKNTREWLYPNRTEIRELLLKCCQLNVVPVLIGRRIPFVTFKLLNACGVIVHQTYGQRVPESDRELASKLKDKTLFGYHDIVLGNQPDPRLNKFLHTNLPGLLERMRPVYEEFADLSRAYGGGMDYEEFDACVSRRNKRRNEIVRDG